MAHLPWVVVVEIGCLRGGFTLNKIWCCWEKGYSAWKQPAITHKSMRSYTFCRSAMCMCVSWPFLHQAPQMIFASTSSVFQNFFCEQRAFYTSVYSLEWAKYPGPMTLRSLQSRPPGDPAGENWTLPWIFCVVIAIVVGFTWFTANFLFNENPNMWATAKILRVRVGEHSSKFCEQIEQRPKNFYDHSMVPAFDKPRKNNSNKIVIYLINNQEFNWMTK